MNKITIAIDGTHYPEDALKFTNKLNELRPILLTGVFLPMVDYSHLWSYSAGGIAGPLFIPVVAQEDLQTVQNNIARFKVFCEKSGIEYSIHEHQIDLALSELRKESRFSDLLVLDSEQFYENVGTNQPNDYLRDALHLSECPILLVPKKFVFPQTNILAYDGTSSSLYAIKHFAYLFPELCQQETMLVYQRDDQGSALPEEENIREFASRHFSTLTYTTLHLEGKKHFGQWIADRKSAILVSGAYGRSVLSQQLNQSFITRVIADHRLPVFVAHR
jgi:hypothetical protein